MKLPKVHMRERAMHFASVGKTQTSCGRTITSDYHTIQVDKVTCIPCLQRTKIENHGVIREGQLAMRGNKVIDEILTREGVK